MEKTLMMLFRETKIGLRVFLLGIGLVGELAAQTMTDAVSVEMGLGNQGTASELILAPKVGHSLRDPTWLYILQPDGTPNPAFPFPLPGIPIPVQPGVPAGLTDLSDILPGWNVAQKRTNVRDGFPTMRQVLFPACIVQAAQEWQDSGFLVTAGHRFQLAATGRWFLDKSGGVPSEECGPEGFAASNPAGHLPQAGHPPWPKPEALGGALIARIGDGPTFLVGAGGTFTADRSGNIFFVMNDLFDGGAPGGSCVYCTTPGMTHISNNSGSVQVVFTSLP